LTLRVKAHDGSTVLAFDKRYMSLLCQVNPLAGANIVHHGMPVFNAMAITAMVVTHSFHVPCGKMMVTLEDMSMILGFLIRGCLIIGRVDSAMWHERVAVFVGREPLAKVLGMKGHEARVRVRWLHEEFQVCPQDADEATMTLYAKARVWHMFATMLFLDSTGDTACWMYIPTLSK
jgi:hypothetical protein